MICYRRELGDVDIPFLEVDESLGRYDYLGGGEEGVIRAYDDFIAFKLFFDYNNIKTRNKFKKIAALSELNDPNACFPWGFAGTDREIVDGYFFERINSKMDYKKLSKIKNSKRKLQVLVETSDAVKRFHNMGLIIGDIKQNNILIDQDWNVKFIDTDNWMYGNFGYDLLPDRASWFAYAFNGKRCTQEENDKYVLGLMVMDVLMSNFIDLYDFSEYFSIIRHLNVSSNCKEGLELIMSDSLDKPYIGDVLRGVNPEKEIISDEKVKKFINRFKKGYSIK